MLKGIKFGVMTCLINLIFIFNGSELTADEHQKSGWYIGLGIGSGQGKVEGDTFNEFNKMLGDSLTSDLGTTVNVENGTPITLNFGAGVILTSKIHLGFEGSIFSQQDNKFTLLGSTLKLNYQINNYFVALSFFPFDTGLSLKAGGGLSSFVFGTVLPDGSKETSSYKGKGYLIGTGYDFWIGEKFNLGLHVDYSKQKYNSSNAPKDTDFISVYVSFYWF